MDKYKEFILLARNNGTGGVAAPGFGAPKKSKRKPTKEQLAKWRSKSDSEQESYLKKYPNSMFKDLPRRGSIISRSKKISRSSTAIALAQEATDTLKDWGVKGKKLTTSAAHSMIKSANEFLKKDRRSYIETANNNFKKFMSKLSSSDKNAVDDEIKEIVKTGHKPSRTIIRKKLKGALPALIGLALAGAAFGAMATGFIPPEAIAFIGVKAIDAAWDSIRHVTHESGGITAIVTGSIIKDYLNSKDSDEDVEKTKEKLEKQHGSPEEEKEPVTDVKPEDKSTVKDLGFEIDKSKYEQDAEGNWIRKRS